MSMRGSKSLLTIIAIGATALMLGSTSQANAQWFFSNRLEPQDIIGIIHREGFKETNYPYFRGDIYVVDVVDSRGRSLRLILDPKSGEIVERLIIGRDQRLYPAGLGREPLPEAGGRREGRGSANGERAPGIRPKKTQSAQKIPPRQAEPEGLAPEAPAQPSSIPAPKATPARSEPSSPSPPTSAAPVAPVQPSGERGTKENPRRVGPVMTPAAGAD